jgi:16S rRNA processing protein RimM
VARNEGTENVLVGQVGRPHGLRGEMRVEVMSDIPERFEPGSELFLVRRDGTTEQVCVQAFRPAKGGGLVFFDGYVGRDQVESLRGARLEVNPSQVPPAPEGLYYYWQLTGCRCVDDVVGHLGEVVDIVEDGGGVLLKVRDGEQTLLIPFVEAFLGKVDIEGQKIELRLPEGLMETCVSKS